MAEDALVTGDLEVGRELVDQLARQRFPLKAAAWVHESSAERWRLYLVTPVRNRDLRDAYVRASEAILANKERKDDWKGVSFNIVDAKEPLGKRIIQWAKDTRRDYRRVSGSTPEGSIEAFVYRAAA